MFVVSLVEFSKRVQNEISAKVMPKPQNFSHGVSRHFFRIGSSSPTALPRGHKSTGEGLDQAREASEVSFHSLRHSAVTTLKAAGVSDFIAREIVGRESAAISRRYTHFTTDGYRENTETGEPRMARIRR